MGSVARHQGEWRCRLLSGPCLFEPRGRQRGMAGGSRRLPSPLRCASALSCSITVLWEEEGRAKEARKAAGEGRALSRPSHCFFRGLFHSLPFYRYPPGSMKRTCISLGDKGGVAQSGERRAFGAVKLGEEEGGWVFA